MRISPNMLPLISALAFLALCALCFASDGSAAEKTPSRKESSVLFRNVRIFNGRDPALSPPSDVMIEGNKIGRVTSAGEIIPPPGTEIVEGEGRTLMPGLIDAHWHAMLAAVPMQTVMTADIGYCNLAAGAEAGKTLLRGFTTVRDCGGPVFGLKRAIDEGVIAGPRIYPSGAMISQTGGHGDFRPPYETPAAPGGPLSYSERIGAAAIADGADAVRLRCREQFRKGASQLKLMGGGGVASSYDPLDVTQYTVEELRAAVAEAENWGTYVAVHVYTPRAVQAALQAGVKSIEHGQLMDEDTAKAIAEHGAWLSLQPFLADEDGNAVGEANRAKQQAVAAGTERAYRLAGQYKIKLAFGTDTLFNAALAGRQGKQLVKLNRWFSAPEILRMATSGNAGLLALSGPRNPYPGKLGVVEEGALADLLLVNGDPLENLHLVAEPEASFVVIMKDGRIHKNLLPRGEKP